MYLLQLGNQFFFLLKEHPELKNVHIWWKVNFAGMKTLVVVVVVLQAKYEVCCWVKYEYPNCFLWPFTAQKDQSWS